MAPIRSLLSILSLALTCSAAAAKPNIVLIIADDMGYGDVGCYGGKMVPTPAIDSLARAGVRCTDGYVTAPLCAPSRCGIMTGAYNERFGIQGNEDRAHYAVGQQKLLPQALKAAGYYTGQIGKWNIGSDITGCFDETRDVCDWEADYFPTADGHYIGVDDPKKHDSDKKQGVWGPEKTGDEYLTDRMGRHAVEFIDRHRTGAPFFLYLAFNAVHSPWQAKAADRARFGSIRPEPLDCYAAMTSSLDENIGRVLAKLKADGLESNTIVIFASDNGPARGPIKGWHPDWPKQVIVGSAGPLNGYKGTFWEGGYREPFIFCWPGQLPAGATYHQPVVTFDFYRTLLAAAGAPVPSDTILDGVNLLPYLRGETNGAPHDILFWKNDANGAVRQGDWKLIISADKLQLFNLATDLGEQHDLADTQPALAAKLHQAWLDWSAPMPAPVRLPAKPRAAAGSSDTTSSDRATLFDKKDVDHDGKLSLEEFLRYQADPEAAKARFERWDPNHDGYLSREEFIQHP